MVHLKIGLERIFNFSLRVELINTDLLRSVLVYNGIRRFESSHSHSTGMFIVNLLINHSIHPSQHFLRLLPFQRPNVLLFRGDQTMMRPKRMHDVCFVNFHKNLKVLFCPLINTQSSTNGFGK